MDFSPEEKIAIFNKIEQNYFIRNFGTMTKADWETLLFSEYIEHRIKNNLPYDDYSLSKILGITQARVRNLKERKELKYPFESFNWQQALAESIKNAKYDPNDHYVKMIVPDVNVMNEVRNFIEVEGWFDECSLNRKLLRIPLECFVEIFYKSEMFESVFTEDVKIAIRKITRADNAAAIAFVEDFSKEGLKTFLMSASKEALTDVIKLLPFGGVAKIGFDFLLKAIEGA